MKDPATEAESNSTRKPKRLRRWAILISIVVHLVLLGVVIAFPLRSYFAEEKTQPETVQSSGAAEGSTASPSSLPESAAPKKEAFKPKTPDELAAEQLNKTLTENDKSEEENLDELKRLSKKLDRFSSADSVDDMTNKVQQLAGVEGRATMPSETPVEGAFDFDTAQIHDVTRTKDEKGNWAYEAVMIDSAGRTQNTTLDTATGESLHKTMQTVKANPLLEKVYRQMAMPILDNLIQAKKAAAKAASEVEVPAEVEEPQ